MFHETKPGILQSDIFPATIIHGFSTRLMGDMRHIPPRKKLKEVLHASSFRLVDAQQIHEDSIALVIPENFSKTVPGVDGLVYQASSPPEKVLLAVLSADCVPILMADSDRGIIGAVHAGWKGAKERIAARAIGMMADLGARIDSIRVAIGPHIGPCCYSVSGKRAEIFRNQFGGSIVTYKNDCWHIDLGRTIVQTLLASGIDNVNIDISDMCTYDNPVQLFSFRRDGKETYGEQMAVIGLKSI